MPWICNYGICPDSERECEDCEHYAEDNEVHWVDRNGDCAVCKHVEKDPREEPCFHCGILRKGFEPKDIEAFLREREPFMFQWGNNTGK